MHTFVYVMGWISTSIIFIVLGLVLAYTAFWYFCAWRQLIRVRAIHRRQGGTPAKLSIREWFRFTGGLFVRTPNLITHGVVVYFWSTKLGHYR